ncbi:sodium:calcium antiporter [Anaerobacillus sp. CMMVII]|uniref:sodium:calcium antiporter n=1 Tax=Anaerobacillus sp. CMMVII TaxID=2755588 RepID=UPI0021B814D8|nr:sodium:calcium antiporter [Anaerobacillus sp. CMMVII]MCT8138962.1 sodium:calcium antiporter [Anaerobacillus sp. CMMVII]
MLFLVFFLVAMITVLTATKLSTYADVISEKTAVGGMLIGSMLLAGATSLPEITTSYTAIILDNPDLAVGSILGSNVFNLVILATLDLYFRKDQVFERVWTQHRYTIGIGIGLMFIILFSLRLNVMYIILGIGIDTFVILAGYIIGMLIMSKLKQTPKNKEENPPREAALPPLSARQAMARFLIASIIILVAGTALTITGDRIAVVTGLGASFVGSFLIAASTSLPEAVACFVACRLRNFNLAIGSILGSNLFNILILCGTDIFYRQGPLLVHVEPVHELTASLTIFLYLVTFYLLIRVRPRTTFNYSIPSILILFTYFITSYYIFFLS